VCCPVHIRSPKLCQMHQKNNTTWVRLGCSACHSVHKLNDLAQWENKVKKSTIFPHCQTRSQKDESEQNIMCQDITWASLENKKEEEVFDTV
jgi:hypothetical protein